MPMTQCSTCGNRYNTDLSDECPICEYREQSALPESETDLVGQASDPSTDPGTLGKLALSRNSEVVEAAVANPNTPDWAKRRVQGNEVTEPAATPAKPRVQGNEVTEPAATPAKPPQVRAVSDVDASILRELRDIKDASRSTRNFLFILLFVYPPILLLVGLVIFAD